LPLTARLSIARTHSVVLMVLTLFAGLVGCFSVVSFFPFASLFKPSITAALSAGMGACASLRVCVRVLCTWSSPWCVALTRVCEGINGLVPSMLAVIQDPGGSKRFSVAVFFFVIAAFLALSLLSYIAILLLMNSARVRQHLESEADEVRSSAHSIQHSESDHHRPRLHARPSPHARRDALSH
jgi:hypothetical protein